MLLYYSSYSQDRRVDSILKLLKAHPKDTTTIKRLIVICNIYNHSDPDSADKYANEALHLSSELKWEKGTAFAYSILGSLSHNKGEFQSALKYRLSELKIWEKLKMNKPICRTLSNAGTIYSDLGNNTLGMKYYFSALNLAEKIQDTQTIVNAMTNIAGLYAIMSDTMKALEFINHSLFLSEKFKYDTYVPVNLINMASLYSARGYNCGARAQYMKVMEIDRKKHYRTRIGAILMNIASTYDIQRDSADKAGNMKLRDEYAAKMEHYLDSALAEAREMDNKFLEAAVLNNQAEILISRKQFDKASEYLRSAKIIALETGSYETLLDVSKGFYRLYKKSGDYPKALENYERYESLKDSFSGIEQKRSLSELQMKYDTEKKDTENKALAQQNKILELSLANNRYLNYGIGISMAVILAFGLLIFRQQRIKSQQKHMALHQKLLQSQMDPHFIFNSLTAIESYIYEHQPKEAGNYLAQFSRLMRLMLENSSNEKISLATEIEMLEYYLALQKLRLNDKLKYNIKTGENINPQHIMLPPMLLQPFVENVIEHGFRGLDKEGEINIEFSLNGDILSVKITDNGIGYYQSQQQKDRFSSHKSISIDITQQRLKYLNRRRNHKFSLSIRELDHEKVNKGTEVLFTIPV
jgi:tetratricopeptide (TPR) repeat protein